MSELMFPARLVAIRYEALEVISFLLQPLDQPLAPIDPGSHIDIALPNGLMRSYSLSNGPSLGEGYRLTVARDPASRGGSAFMHESLKVGQILQISEPRNNFPLIEDAALSIFIAGGIGVTPFIPMLGRLNEHGKPWRLHYCTRTRERAALLAELESLAAAGTGTVIANFDDEQGILDLAGALARLPPEAHVYCCGPTSMIAAFRTNADLAGIAPPRVHFEYFSGEIQTATEGGFSVVLDRSGQEIEIKPGQTILNALTQHGVNVPYSCEEGICGACETRVIDGIPDHRDLILSDAEREGGKTIMVCCSGSKSPRLVLDL